VKDANTEGGNVSEIFRFAPTRNWAGDLYTPESVTLDDEPKPKAVKPEAEKPFEFAPGSTRKSASFDPFGSDVPATRTEFHISPELQKRVDGEDDEVEHSFRKSKGTFKPGDTVRWLRQRTNFVIEKAIYASMGLWLISGRKTDDSGEIRGIFSPAELATLPA
jgi:hypothetical protein